MYLRDVNFSIWRDFEEDFAVNCLHPAAQPEKLPPHVRPVIDWHVLIIGGVKGQVHLGIIPELYGGGD